MACIFSGAEKNFYILYTKQTDIFIGTVLLFTNLHVYLQKAEFVTSFVKFVCLILKTYTQLESAFHVVFF